MTLIIGSRIDSANVIVARNRLAAWLARHGMPDSWRDEMAIGAGNDPYAEVCAMLREVYLRQQFAQLTPRDARLAIGVLRRAINHPRADYLHRDNTGIVYAAWYPRD